MAPYPTFYIFVHGLEMNTSIMLYVLWLKKPIFRLYLSAIIMLMIMFAIIKRILNNIPQVGDVQYNIAMKGIIRYSYIST